jgi:GNAT superfamily N-acetyltransferase
MTPPAVRIAAAGDLAEAAQLLHDINMEFGEPTPSASALAERRAELTSDGDTVVFLAEQPAVAVAVLRLGKSIWVDELEGYLAELYVVPGRRGQGGGRAVMEDPAFLRRSTPGRS